MQGVATAGEGKGSEGAGMHGVATEITTAEGEGLGVKAMQKLCECHAKAMRMPCEGYAQAMCSPCRDHAEAMNCGLHLPCHAAFAMQRPCC